MEYFGSNIEYTPQDIEKEKRKLIDKGAKARDIEKALTTLQGGVSYNYNPLTEPYNWEQLPSNITKNLQEFGSGIRSLGGAVLNSLGNTSTNIYNVTSPMVTEESSNIAKGNILNAFKRAVSKNTWNRVKRDLTGIITGVKIGSAIPMLNPVAGGVAGLLASEIGPKNLVNAMLSPYNISTEDIIKGNVDIRDIGQGIMENPLFVTMDLLATPKVSKVLSDKIVNPILTKQEQLHNTISAMADVDVPNKQIKLGDYKYKTHNIKGVLNPDVMQIKDNIGNTFYFEKEKNLADTIQKLAKIGAKVTKPLFPSSETKAKNVLLTETVGKTRANLAKQYEGLNALNTMPLVDREKIVRAITYNDFEGLNEKDTKLANLIKNNIQDATNTAIEEGFIPKTEAETNVVAQYATMKNANEFPGLTHKQVYDYIEGKPGVTLPDKVVGDIIEGFDLQDKNKIQYLSQMIAQSTDPTGRVIAKELLEGVDNYWDSKRIIGRSQPEQIGKVLESTLKLQFDQVYKAKEAKIVANDIINTIGKKVEEDYKLKPGEIFVDSKGIESAIKKIYNSGNLSSIKTIGGNAIGKNGYVIERKDLTALYNALKPPKSGIGTRYMNIAKKNLLATPHWFMQNRVGNISNNIIEGVTPNDYNDAKKYISLIPEQLQSQTSFNAYLGTALGEESSILKRSIFKKPMKEAVTKTLRARTNTSRLEGINDILTNSWFKAESTSETIDRYANMIRQAKRLGKQEGKDWKEIIKLANDDAETYRYLNLKVNKSLGDYVGKNYYLDPRVYDVARELVPFYRFYTQTARTTWNQLKDHPLAFQSMIGIPTKAGLETKKDIEERYKLKKTDYKGGVPYYKKGREVRVIGTEPLPINAVLETLGEMSVGDPGGSITNPFLTGYANIANMSYMGRPIVTPGLIEAKKKGKDKEYEYPISERASVTADTLAQLLLSPYRISKTYGGDLYNLIFNKPYQPLMGTLGYNEIPTGYVKTEPYEKIGRWFGIQTQGLYKQRPKTGRQRKAEVRRGARYRRRIKSRQRDL